VRLKSWLPGTIVFLISFIIYLKTLCPTVYWGDSAELIAVAANLGIAHPSGYPTYTLLGKLFTLIPYGNIAWRVNLMSAFLASLAVLMLYLICYRLSKHIIPSAAAALAFAFSRIFWSQSVVAEVYTMHILLLAINTLLLLYWLEHKKTYLLYLFCFTFGLSLTHNLASFLFIPGFALLVTSSKGIRKLRRPKVIVACLLLIMAGLLPYLYLPIRGSMDPSPEWGNTEDPDNLLGHITGRQYRNYFQPSMGFAEAGHRYLYSFRVLTSGFDIKMIIVWIMSIFGFFLQFKVNKRISLSLIITFLLVMLFSSSYIIPDIETYYLPCIFLLFVFASVGMTRVIYRVNDKGVDYKRFFFLSSVLLLILPFAFLMGNYEYNDKSEQYFPHSFAGNLLSIIENNSVIISKPVQSISPLIYYKEVEKEKDFELITLSMLGNHWYMDRIIEKYGVSRISFPKAGKGLQPHDVWNKKNQKYDEFMEEFIRINKNKFPIYIYSLSPRKSDNYSLYDLGLLYQVIDKDYPPLQNKTYRFIFNSKKSTDPYDEEALHRYANAYFRFGLKALETSDLKQAENNFIEAVRLDNRFLQAHYNLAVTYYYQRNYSASFVYLKNAYILSPKDKDVMSLLQVLKKELDN